jgi:hypothetical protein
MDTHLLFNQYLLTYPAPFITWPEKGKEKLMDFFYHQENEPLSPHYFMDDLLDFIKEEAQKNKVCEGLTASQWIDKYFKSSRGREMKKAHMKYHEPHLAYVAFNIEPLKGLMDGFIMYVISKEVLPCMMK